MEERPEFPDRTYLTAIAAAQTTAEGRPFTVADVERELPPVYRRGDDLAAYSVRALASRGLVDADISDEASRLPILIRGLTPDGRAALSGR
jgi:hypothetical protein